MKKIESIFRFRFFSLLAFAAGVISLMTACDKEMEGKLFRVSDQKMIDETMESNPDLSQFLKIVDISNMRGTIHAYGTYTFFAPTNNGVNEYLTSIGKTVDNLSQEEALQIVKYHLVSDTLATSDFVDGRLASPNFLNEYITTKTIAVDAGVSVEVNRQAYIQQKDVRCGNGILHVVDKVLYQPKESIADRINALPQTFSLMKEVFNRSNIVSKMKNSNADAKSWYTFFVQDNDAFASQGITDMDALLARLRAKSPAIASDDSLINNYVAYHCVPELNYVADLLLKSSLNTLVANQVIVIKRDNEQVRLNEFEINGALEEGIPVNRESNYTDWTCSNGVIHQISGNIEIVNRSAYRVYWDLADQPEIMALKGFRKAGTSVTFQVGELSEITWGGTTPYTVDYYCTGYPSAMTKDNNYIYGDYIHFFRISSNIGAQWVQLKTPLLVAGKYKVWIGMRYINTDTNTPQDLRTIFKQDGQDDQILGVTTINYGVMPKSYGLTDMNSEFHQRAELDGQKVYTASFYDSANPCFLLGTIEVNTTGRHILRLEPLKSIRFNPNLDVIHFIPIDEDQIWPKQDARGKLIYENTPDCEIYPYSNCDEGTGETDQ